MATLKQKAYKGLFWTALDILSNQGLQFIIGIVLARILTPEEFGLIGMVTVFITISAVFVDSGFGIALINKKNTSIDEESAVFWLNLIMSFLLFGLLYLIAPVIARFYEEPVLTDITRVLGLVLIVQAFGTIHLNLLSKELDFKTQFKLTLTSKIVSGGLGIWAALAGYGVWSLVLQRIVQMTWQSIGLWLFHSWRPKFKFNLTELKPLWKYGSNVLLSRLTKTFFDNIYTLAIGKTFSANELGYYRRARGFQNLPLSFLSSTIGKISFPLYSKVKDDKEKYIKTMRKSLVLMSFISFPVLALLGIIAEPLIVFLIKEKWLPAVPYLQWLCVSGMLFPWHLMNVQSLLGYGRSDLNLKITFIKNSLRLINLLIMMNFSVLHIVIGEVIFSFIGLIINTYYNNKIFNYGLLKQFLDLKWIILVTLIAAGMSFLPLLADLSPAISLLLQITIFIVIYYVLSNVTDKKLVTEIKDNVRGIIQ
ncbi:lipopolysaccharide biosynthesis protein [Saccharicrinis sp. FJH2]|uniref:lipopolysaccharide biosynthesis protein n=1 Tax=Saccharicrinis sp. FJH65 TaxID=3344659 RepID=UPI0035F3DDD0